MKSKTATTNKKTATAKTSESEEVKTATAKTSESEEVKTATAKTWDIDTHYSEYPKKLQLFKIAIDILYSQWQLDNHKKYIPVLSYQESDKIVLPEDFCYMDNVEYIEFRYEVIMDLINIFNDILKRVEYVEKVD